MREEKTDSPLSRYPQPLSALLWLLLLLLAGLLHSPAMAAAETLLSQLSSQQRTWLEANRDTIRYAPNPYWPPGDYMEKGSHKGIVSDYIKYFEDSLGIRFNRVYHDNWPAIMTSLEEGETDLVGAIQKTKEREAFLVFTKPFLTTYLAVIVNNSSEITLSRDTINTMSLACPEGYTSLDYLTTTFPKARIFATKDDLDALLRVSAGAIDAAVVDYMAASYLIEKYGITNLKFGLKLDFHWDLRFGINRDMVQLREILDIAISQLSEQQRREIYRRWVAISLDNPTFFVRHQRTILMLLATATFFLCTATIFLLLLKRQVANRTMDLTQASSQLKQSKEYLQTVLDSGSDGVVVHDAATGKIIDANQRMSDMYGYSHDEILKASTHDLSLGKPPYDQEHALQWLQKAREHGQQTFEWQARRKDSSLFWVEVSIRFTTIGGAERFVVFVRDITERLRALQEREELTAMFSQAQKMETIGQLAGGVAHDFNNMLGVILGYAELALIKAEDDHSLKENLEEIINAGKRATDITRQLLAFSRQQPIAPQDLDLNQAIEGTLKMLRRLIGENIQLSWHPASQQATVYLDPSQLDQLLANLCINARDAITDSGEIVIRVHGVTIDSAESETHLGAQPGEYIALSVSDSGCGMDNATRQRIFEPFFTTKEVGKGTGLGLAIVYGIVKQNKGFIDIASEPGAGTTFCIYLPRHQQRAAVAKEVKPPLKETERGGKLLVVEDEKSMLDLTRRILQQLGYTVLTASTPAEAITLANEHLDEIDILVTDVVMPEMNGRELAKTLRARSPELGILYISGYAADMDSHLAADEKGVDFLAKPFTSQEMAAKVDGLLGAG